MTGVTGTPEEIDKMVKAWGVVAEKVPGEGDDYTMNHTASVFLVNRKGSILGTIAYREDQETALAKIRRLIARLEAGSRRSSREHRGRGGPPVGGGGAAARAALGDGTALRTARLGSPPPPASPVPLPRARGRIRRLLLLEQVRASCLGQRFRLLAPPFCDLAVIAAGEDGGDVGALEGLRAGVLGVFQEAVLEAFVGVAVGGAEDAGDEADHRFEQRHRGDFAAGEDEVADRDFLERRARR